jgi:hypothetical protein
MSIKISNDLIHYFHRNSGASNDKREGIAIAIISMLIDNGLTYHEAIGVFKNRIEDLFGKKKEIYDLVLPEAWANDYKILLKESE